MQVLQYEEFYEKLFIEHIVQERNCLMQRSVWKPWMRTNSVKIVKWQW